MIWSTCFHKGGFQPGCSLSFSTGWWIVQYALVWPHSHCYVHEEKKHYINTFLRLINYFGSRRDRLPVRAGGCFWKTSPDPIFFAILDWPNLMETAGSTTWLMFTKTLPGVGSNIIETVSKRLSVQAASCDQNVHSVWAAAPRHSNVDSDLKWWDNSAVFGCSV